MKAAILPVRVKELVYARHVGDPELAAGAGIQGDLSNMPPVGSASWSNPEDDWAEVSTGHSKRRKTLSYG